MPVDKKEVLFIISAKVAHQPDQARWILKIRALDLFIRKCSHKLRSKLLSLFQILIQNFNSEVPHPLKPGFQLRSLLPDDAEVGMFHIDGKVVTQKGKRLLVGAMLPLLHNSEPLFSLRLVLPLH